MATIVVFHRKMFYDLCQNSTLVPPTELSLRLSKDPSIVASFSLVLTRIRGFYAVVMMVQSSQEVGRKRCEITTRYGTAIESALFSLVLTRIRGFCVVVMRVQSSQEVGSKRCEVATLRNSSTARSPFFKHARRSGALRKERSSNIFEAGLLTRWDSQWYCQFSGIFSGIFDDFYDFL